MLLANSSRLLKIMNHKWPTCIDGRDVAAAVAIIKVSESHGTTATISEFGQVATNVIGSPN